MAPVAAGTKDIRTPGGSFHPDAAAPSGGGLGEALGLLPALVLLTLGLKVAASRVFPA